MRNQPFAKRSLGQNFLIDSAVVDRILAAFDPQPEDTVLEIGPGRGALTTKLMERVGKLYALEFDNRLAAELRERFIENANCDLIEGDALGADFSALAPAGKLRLIANLPYNISTAILQRLFEHRRAFSDCVLMFQREVAERITAKPGTKNRGFLTVMTEAAFNVERLFDVSPRAFRPVPKVWSSVVRLTPNDTEIQHRERFREIVSAGFAKRRKTILNNLTDVLPDAQAALIASNIDPKRRAETLTLEEWLALVRSVSV